MDDASILRLKSDNADFPCESRHEIPTNIHQYLGTFIRTLPSVDPLSSFIIHYTTLLEKFASGYLRLLGFSSRVTCGVRLASLCHRAGESTLIISSK